MDWLAALLAQGGGGDDPDWPKIIQACGVALAALIGAVTALLVAFFKFIVPMIKALRPGAHDNATLTKMSDRIDDVHSRVTRVDRRLARIEGALSVRVQDQEEDDK